MIRGIQQALDQPPSRPASPRRDGDGPIGTLYGVGVGPGDPELLTLKALGVLRSVSVVYVPVARPGAASFAGSIVRGVVAGSQQRIEELVFAMRGRPAEREAQWRRNAETIAGCLRAGQDAAFATEGDPLLYSTFVHVLRPLAQLLPEAPVVAIPGVSSVHAAAAATLTPLADGDERLAVLPAPYEGAHLRTALESFDTVVLLKVASAIDQVVELLDEMGLAECAVLVSRCGSADERIVRDVRSLKGQELDYFSTLIVRRGR